MFWPLQENVLGKRDIEGLVRFVRTTERFTQSSKVREFEEAWSKWQGCKHSLYVNSGSSANLLLMNTAKELYGWSDGDEVIVPAVTWVTNISPVIQCGLKPVFVDINLDDFSFDYDALTSHLTPRTRAIFVTHLIGFPADLARIRAIIGQRPIQVLEDCCESYGATVGGRKVGNFGAGSSFSFYWGHHMTTVEGGMVSTDDEDVYKLARIKRSHGLARELPAEDHEQLRKLHPDIDFNFLFLTDGFNFRNSELYAVLGLSQLKRLDKYNSIRNRNHRRFISLIKPYRDRLRVPDHKGLCSFCLPFLCHDREDKKALQRLLSESGIETRPIISGNLMRQPFLQAYRGNERFPNADLVHTNGFYIGNNQFVGEKRLKKLQGLLKVFFASRRAARA